MNSSKFGSECAVSGNSPVQGNAVANGPFSHFSDISSLTPKTHLEIGPCVFLREPNLDLPFVLVMWLDDPGVR